MKKPHKHRDLIIAWANGKEIQVNNGNNTWDNLKNPSWYEETEYRIKPEVIRYRVALITKQTGYLALNADNSTEEKDIENSYSFKKWLTDWIEVEV
jgi:hypothetical protein